jgi:hypothetical protein
MERILQKIDLHLHTIPTFSDVNFTFSLSKLKEYVLSAKLDAIAITNHDIFELDQFNEIAQELDCVVFPGIEINLENGHMLVISENQNLEDFQFKANKVTEKIQKVGDSIKVDELIQIFGDLNDYLLIPHYQKKPIVSSGTIERLSDFIFAGEVNAPKKFIRMIKDEDKLTPVYFSDLRIKEGMNNFPPRQTYIDCGELTLTSIKYSLRDRNKVQLSKNDGNSIFQIFDDGQKLSTGLNIVLGKRSSGKTVTLDRIKSECSNVKYIPQFSLVQVDDSSYEKDFKDDVSRKRSIFSDNHLAPFKKILDDVINIDLADNSRKVNDYLETLLKSADDADKRDTFSNVTLFNETPFDVVEEKSLNELINSVRQLIDNIEYRKVIDKHVNINSLKLLACELITILRSKTLEIKKQNAVNDVVRDIKNKLQLKTSATQIKDFDLYKVMMDHKKVEKFKEIVKELQAERIIDEEHIQGFKIICKQRVFKNAREILNVSGQKVGFGEAYKNYSAPYKYLSSLKENIAFTPSEFYKYFACIEYEILNKDGFKVSGGERSEFRLLQEIKDAQNYDYLLIDEPESSFDNLFLKGEVNQILKDLSKNMPVVIVTHNSTVGASINPDYIVYTSKEVTEQGIEYRRYSGYPSDKELCSIDGNKIDNFKVTMNSLEAGEVAYTERSGGYESIKN